MRIGTFAFEMSSCEIIQELKKKEKENAIWRDWFSLFQFNFHTNQTYIFELIIV